MNLRVYTGGTFDLFHAGHVNFLQQCSLLGPVSVGVNRDEFVAKFKGEMPVCSLNERLTVVRACRYVDVAMANDGDGDSRKIIEAIHPSIVAIGSDWAGKNYYKQMGFDQAWLDERGIMLVYIPYTWQLSSTELKERMREVKRHRPNLRA